MFLYVSYLKYVHRFILNIMYNVTEIADLVRLFKVTIDMKSSRLYLVVSVIMRSPKGR